MASHTVDDTRTHETLLYKMPHSSRDPIIPLAALSVCHINLNSACDHHTEQLKRNYLAEWRYPAPAHCRSAPPVLIEEIRLNRLGLNIDLCEGDK